MTKTITYKPKQFDLEPRTYQFARSVFAACQQLPRNSFTFPLIDQVIRSAGSVGANYIEANESLSKKDFHHRIKICLKEAKESNYWLKLITDGYPAIQQQISPLIQESGELVKIFSAILHKNSF